MTKRQAFLPLHILGGLIFGLTFVAADGGVQTFIGTAVGAVPVLFAWWMSD